MSQKYNIEFNPIQCTSSIFKKLEPQDGFLYFLTDTKQIYLGKENEFIDMCGGINIFYGIKEVVYENSGLAPDPYEVFERSHLEGSSKTPLVNDLILNSDGCFYKIETVEDDAITAKRLTLQGSGGGGGGGSSDGGTGYSVMVSPEANIFSSQDEHMFINVQANMLGNSDNYISSISFSKGGPVDIEKGIEPFYTVEGQFAMGTALKPQVHPIDLVKYKDLFDTQVATTFYVNTTDAYGLVRSKKFSVRLINLEVLTSEKNIFVVNNDVKNYSCTINGGSTGVYDKKLVFAFYPEDRTDKDPVNTPQEIPLNATLDKISLQEKITTTALSHGVYTLQVYAQATLSGTENSYIKSNIITHKVICFKSGSSTILLAASLPEKIEQYTNVPLNYMLSSTEEGRNYTLNVSIDGVPKTSLNMITNQFASYDLYFETKGAHTVELKVAELGNLTYNFQINVLEYTGKLPIIESSGSLILNLDPKGQSNNSTNPNQWRDEYNNQTAILENLYLGGTTGWCKDENGIYYLSLKSGGQLKLPTFKPFALDPTEQAGLTIELDFELSGITDYNADLITFISQSQQSVVSTGFKITGNKAYFYNSSKNGQGNNGSLVSLNLIENKRIRLSFVIEPNDDNHPYPMILSYLNGIISSATIYNKNDSFVDSDMPATLVINSSAAAIKIYGIRFYSMALSHREILNNFTASLPTLEERQERYASNLVYNEKEEISKKLVADESYDLGIPYMLLTGGWQTDNKNDKWKLLNSNNLTPDLPADKKDYRLVDVEVIYPKTTYFKNYKNYSFKNKFENGLSFQENLGNKPSNGGCIMYCQGTSSMEYPVKNLRLRFNKVKKIVDGVEKKSKENFFRVRPNIEPVEIICMKADYMESSGSHNTGAANLIDDLYVGASLRTPGQIQFDKEDAKIVTCIKGHPCLIFYRKTEADEYSYIGKYNLNLDKATPTPFGFNHDDEFGWLDPGEEYYSIGYDDDGDKFIGQENPDDGGDYDDSVIEELKEVQEGEKINSIHCFEFLDNAVAVCNFLSKTVSEKDYEIDPVRPVEFIYEQAKNVNKEDFDKLKKAQTYFYILVNGKYQRADGEFDPNTTYYEQKYTYRDSWYRKFLNSEGDVVPGWALGFESRYPEDRLGMHDADMLWPLASWLNELHTLRKEEEKNGLSVNDKKYIYNYNEATEYQEFVGYYEKVGDDYIPAYPTEDTFGDNTYYTQTIVEVQFDMTSLERFKREYECYLDKDFLLAYYIITEALLMADSRVKNMMIATWNKERRSFKNLSGETIETNNYIFYPIFYDMDTMLGLDNTGVNRFNYYDEDNDPSTYNGEEVLWNFVRDTLFLELDSMYRTLESAGLNIDINDKNEWAAKSILPYFNNNQANMANEAFYNSDAEYKYIRPAVEGYYDGLNKKPVAPGAAPYLYAAQGDRSLMREYFITNRIKFLRGKHNSKKFQEQDRITFRWYYPTGNEDNFNVVIGKEADGTDILGGQSVSAVRPSTTFDFTSLQTCYAGVLLGANGNVVKERFEGAQQKQIVVAEGSSANGTEAYLLGVDGLSNLGDLSNKYMQKFIINTETKLKTLILGNPSQYYYNPFWRPKTGSAEEINISGCKYLEEFNLQNCSSYNAGLNFTNCPAISKILLTGSSVNNITLPINGALTELRLPTSVRKLTIDSHKKLEKQNFSIGGYNYGSQKSIGANDGGSYTNDYSQLTDIFIKDTPIDTYEMVSNATSLQNYNFQGFNWRITDELDTQYVTTQDGAYNQDKKYYIWSTKQNKYITLEAYKTENNYTNISDLFLEKSTIIKEKIDLIGRVGGTNAVVNIPILDYLHSKTPIGGSHETALSGTITLAVAMPINQFNLYKKYKSWYPNVSIEYDKDVVGEDNIIKAYSVQFYNIDNITNDTEPYYTVLTDGTYTLKDLTSSTGPSGIALNPPVKTSTATINYIFTEKWQIYGSNTFITTEEFSTYKPSGDIKLIPVYEEKPRTYSVTLYDYTGNKVDPSTLTYISEKITNPLLYEYEQTLYHSNEDCVLYLYRDDSDLESTQRYSFKGWVSKGDFNTLKTNPNYKPNVINPETYKVSYDIELYPYYVIEDAANTPSDLRFFNIESKNLEYGLINYDEGSFDFVNNTIRPKESTTTLVNELCISIKPQYINQLKGKITLPNSYNNKPITAILNMRGTQINSIYFLEGNSYKAIGEGNSSNDGFFGCKALKHLIFPEGDSNLKYIGSYSFYGSGIINTSLPNSIEYIGTEAFRGTNIALNNLPYNLTYLGNSAFKETNIALQVLPPNLTTIPTQGFMGCKKIKLISFGNNGINVDAYDNNVKYILGGAFANSGVEENEATLTFKNSVVFIGTESFKDYLGKNTQINIANQTQYSNELLEEKKVNIFGSNKSVVILEPIENNSEFKI